MATLYTHKDSNIRKTWALMFFFLVLVIAVGWGVSWYYDSPLLLYVATGFALFMNVFSYWFSDKIVVKMTGAKPMPDEGQFKEVHNIVENLAITSGLPKPRLYVVEDSAPNAFATGRDPKHAVVAVTTGLLSILDRSELEGVLAHELSHVGNRDMLVSTIAVVLVGFLAILADIVLRSLHFGSDSDKKHPLFLVIGLVGAILIPIAAQLIQLAISRKREFLADASGALLTRYPEGLANALRKIGAYSQPMRKKSHATAHLFLANPFGPQALRGLDRMFMTHPPIEDRIKALLGR